MGAGGVERPIDLIRIGRLRQIVDRANLDRCDRGRDVAIAGQHDDAHIGPHVFQRAHQLETAAAGDFQVHDRVARRLQPRDRDRALDIARADDLIAAPLHGENEALSQHVVIVDDEQGACLTAWLRPVRPALRRPFDHELLAPASPSPAPGPTRPPTPRSARAAR